ncbi:putative defense protein 3 [Daphnia pulicaria]|uniref:putative defense protein 3 n=1 Tax=Daphnia pulicaria TaxID=35523 RepID=UPI001EEA127A|nr:putative defense protein 3 [Daphnia pulicaria]
MSGSQKIFKRICLTTLVLFLTLNGNKIAVHGSSSGSPVQACVDMVPDHHVDAQTSASPFVTTPSVTSAGNDSTITLTLAPVKTGIAFKGFLIMGFNNANHTEGPIGSFSSISNGQIIDCPGGSPKNAATHSNSDNKTSVTVDWTAPAQFVGTVLFKTTYAENGGIFWVATPSAPVTFV